MFARALRLTALALSLLGTAACGDGLPNPAILGSYDVQVSRDGLSDPDVLTVAVGAKGTLVLDFATGIEPGVGSPSKLGLSAKLNGSALQIEPQQARVAHSTGDASGLLSASGSFMGAGGGIQLTLSFQPTDGPDAGQTVQYDVTGPKL
jgi:hypothetical protein